MQFLICLLLLLIFSACKNKKEAETNVIQTIENENISEKGIINEEFLDSWFNAFNTPPSHYDHTHNINIKLCRLKFYKWGGYIFIPDFEGDSPYIEGSYQIINNKILLKYINIPYYEYPEEPQYYKFDDILKEDWELEYTSIDNSIFYTEGLVGKGIIFGREKSRPKAGDIIITKEYAIVAVERTEMSLPCDAIVRIGPGINYQNCIFELYDHALRINPTEDNKPDYETILNTGYLKKGYTIILLGHSVNTDTIDGLTGYWYYCWIIIWVDMGGKIIEPKTTENNGWIFGPSIGLK